MMRFRKSREVRFHAYACWASATVIVLGLMVLLGWYFDIAILKRLHPSLAAMKVNSALLFVMLGIALGLPTKSPPSSLRQGLGLVIAIVAGIILVEFFIPFTVRFDELFFFDKETLPERYPGRMAPATALNFVLIGSALFFEDGPRKNLARIAVVLAILISLAAFFTFIYCAQSLYDMRFYSSMALHSVFGFLLAGFAFFFFRPQRGMVGVLASEGGAGTLTRRLLPVMILLPIFLGWLLIRGRQYGFYTLSVGVSLWVLAIITILTAVMFRSALAIQELEKERAIAFEEKEILIKEVHHRVKNNLQVISSLLYLQCQKAKDPSVKILLEESRNRIQSIALVHEKLYNSDKIAVIDFVDYLKSFTHDLAMALDSATPQAKITIHAQRVFLTMEHAIPCALIVNELVSNAIKYAFPADKSGEVFILVGPTGPIEEHMFQLVVGDTGIGFPEEIDFTATATLGMQLVCSLTKQLRGTVHLSRVGGTRFEIVFPVGK